jgi:hypothetical protein
MKKRLFIFLLALIFIYSNTNKVVAQFVTIPDTAFVSFLSTSVYSTCITGNQLDTVCLQNQIAAGDTIYYISGTQIVNLEGIQYFEGLTILYCDNGVINNIPGLPNSLSYFQCVNNYLTTLPPLPENLIYFYCQHNDIVYLPDFPPNLLQINCGFNNLRAIPEITPSMNYLDVSYNPNLGCLPFLPATLTHIDWIGTMINCFPNYEPAVGATPPFPGLCLPGNPSGCDVFANISGIIFEDGNSNCLYNVVENTREAKVKLYNGSNLEEIYYSYNGVYGFNSGLGTFNVVLDTIRLPYVPSCIHPGEDSLVMVSPADSIITNVDFSIDCKPGFDIGAWSIIRTGTVFFPGQYSTINITAGDYSKTWGNLSCATSVSGIVSVNVSGLVNYVGPSVGSLIPTSIVGNTINYSIADFGTVNFATDFGIILQTDTSANTGDTICVTVTVTPTVGDNNPENNTLTTCFVVANSYDPNIKEVYPGGNVLYPFTDWLTYTIHFQNTGNALAYNIRLEDIIDADLDLETFELLSYSHDIKVAIYNRVATFRFRDIMLPDSSSDYEGSIGYVQYRIKPNGVLPVGTSFDNFADIYFDFNAPIHTNTAHTQIYSTTGMDELGGQPFALLYPNPASNEFNLKMEDDYTIEYLQIVDLTGKIIARKEINSSECKISVSGYSEGIYFVQIIGKKGTINKKFIVKS